jgi:hypothetical protein
VLPAMDRQPLGHLDPSGTADVCGSSNTPEESLPSADGHHGLRTARSSCRPRVRVLDLPNQFGRISGAVAAVQRTARSVAVAPTSASDHASQDDRSTRPSIDWRAALRRYRGLGEDLRVQANLPAA